MKGRAEVSSKKGGVVAQLNKQGRYLSFSKFCVKFDFRLLRRASFTRKIRERSICKGYRRCFVSECRRQSVQGMFERTHVSQVCKENSKSQKQESCCFVCNQGWRKSEPQYFPFCWTSEIFKDDGPTTEKSEKVKSWLLECVKDNLLFTNLDQSQKEMVISRFSLESTKKGQSVITQGLFVLQRSWS